MVCMVPVGYTQGNGRNASAAPGHTLNGWIMPTRTFDDGRTYGTPQMQTGIQVAENAAAPPPFVATRRFTEGWLGPLPTLKSLTNPPQMPKLTEPAVPGVPSVMDVPGATKEVLAATAEVTPTQNVIASFPVVAPQQLTAGTAGTAGTAQAQPVQQPQHQTMPKELPLLHSQLHAQLHELQGQAPAAGAAEVLAYLDKLVSGLAHILDQAQIFQNADAGMRYCTRIAEWILQEEAAELMEIFEHFEKLAEFASMKSLPKNRVLKELERVLGSELKSHEVKRPRCAFLR